MCHIYCFFVYRWGFTALPFNKCAIVAGLNREQEQRISRITFEESQNVMTRMKYLVAAATLACFWRVARGQRKKYLIIRQRNLRDCTTKAAGR